MSYQSFKSIGNLVINGTLTLPDTNFYRFLHPPFKGSPSIVKDISMISVTI